MIRQLMRVGSMLLGVSACTYAMKMPSLKDIAIKKVAELAAHDLSYCVKAFDILPHELSTSLIQDLMSTNRPKSALPILLLSCRLYQQQQLNNKQSRIHVICSDNQQVQLTPEQSRELIQHSAPIRNLIQDTEGIQYNEIPYEEVPLPVLTQKQVTTLLSYISIINALNTSNSTLPMLQQDIPEAATLSPYCFKYAALQQLKEYLATQTIPTLCDLIIAASYLAIQNSQHMVNFVELVTHALGDKLLQAPEYQDEYTIIHTLPDTDTIQRILVHYLVHVSKIRSVLCGNTTDGIIKKAQTLPGHTNIVDSVSWSSDGKHIVSSSNCHTISYDNTIKIWDTITGTYIHILENHGSVWSVSWSPDGKYLASGSEDKTVKIWSISTGTCVRTSRGHTDKVYSVSWSPNGKYIASGSFDDKVKIWDVNTGTCIHTLTGHTGWVSSVSWSPDSTMIASGSFDWTVKIWDATTGTCIHTLNHTECVTSVSWSPDGRKITGGSAYNTIKVWDTYTGTRIHTLKGHTEIVWSVAWSPDGKYIASGSRDGEIKIWDANTGTCIHTLKGHTKTVQSVAWSPDGSQLVSGSYDDTVRVWNIIHKKLDTQLKNIVLWQQALLLVYIINTHNNQHDIDFTHDTRALQCYNNLDQRIKQLVEPLLSERTRNTLHAAKNLDRLIKANPVQAALFGVGLQIGIKK